MPWLKKYLSRPCLVGPMNNTFFNTSGSEQYKAAQENHLASPQNSFLAPITPLRRPPLLTWLVRLMISCKDYQGQWSKIPPIEEEKKSWTSLPPPWPLSRCPLNYLEGCSFCQKSLTKKRQPKAVLDPHIYEGEKNLFSGQILLQELKEGCIADHIF